MLGTFNVGVGGGKGARIRGREVILHLNTYGPPVFGGGVVERVSDMGVSITYLRTLDFSVSLALLGGIPNNFLALDSLACLAT